MTYEKLFEHWVRAAKKQNDSTVNPKDLRERLAAALATEWPTAVEQESTGERIILTRPDSR